MKGQEAKCRELLAPLVTSSPRHLVTSSPRQRRIHISSQLAYYASGVDRSRFDKLHVKLFLAIAGSIGALTVGVYFVFMSSFERGFVQYLNRADDVRLASLIERLAEGYAREGSWSWIADDREWWSAMSREALGLPRARR